MATPASLALLLLLLTACGGEPDAPPPTPPPTVTPAQQVLPEGVQERTTEFHQRTRTYLLFVPPSDGTQPMPVVMLHHGTGGTGLELITAWLTLARSEQVILIAPRGESRLGWLVPDDGPELQVQLIDELRRTLPIDPRRVYLFGYSNGGDFVFYAAIQQSEYFAAAAIHSAALRPRQFPMLDLAPRKIPLWYSAGTEDPIFTIQEARATVDALRARSWPLDYVERTGKGHEYLPAESNSLIWNFLKTRSLPSDPTVTPLSPAWLQYALR
jgi:poly(3-hydroxybutyrate) depolymerase